MDLTTLFIVLAVAIPLVASIGLWMSSGVIAERHHSHHDTYVVASPLIWIMVFAMILMGALGILLGWLCMVEVFHANSVVVLSFFDSFLVISFVHWLLLRRYKVVTYDDCMYVTPFLGRRTKVAYSEISAMEWTRSLLRPSTRNVRVFVGHRRRALLWCGLDLEQILIRIDRFDVLDTLRS